MTNPLNERVPTGIQGLDVVLDGGLQHGCVYVLRGQPGAGKTVLANHISFHLAERGRTCTYFSVLAESSDRMLAQVSRFQFYRPELVGKRLSYVAGYRLLQEGGIQNLLAQLRETVAKQPAQLLVVDGLHTVSDAAVDVREFKRFIHDVQSMAMMTQSIVLLLRGGDPNAGVEPELTIVDGVIDVTDELLDMRALRHVHVRKLRGASQIRGKHTLAISDAGITVMPRVETRSRADDRDIPRPDESTRIPFGVERLDGMLGGGVAARSITMLVGPTGCGKTTLASQFLASDEPALYFGFYEQPRELIEKAARVGIRLDEAARSEKLHFVWQLPVEAVLDVLADRLLQVVAKHGIRRLCIDGIHTFGRTIDYPERLPDALASLQTELQKANVTTVYTLETPDTSSPEPNIAIEDVSATAQNIIMLRRVEVDAEMRRVISIVKVRECEHDLRAYEFKITQHGIWIADSNATAAEVLAKRRREQP